MYLRQLVYGKRLQGKAQGYLEVSIAVKSAVPARLTLAEMFDETEQLQKAKVQRKLVLENISDGEEPLVLENKQSAIR